MADKKMSEARLKELERLRVGAGTFELREACREIRRSWAAEDKAARKLLAGTLHVLTCNADHRGPIGNDGCSCPPGREIRRFRAENAALRERIEQLEERECYGDWDACACARHAE